MEHTHHSFFIDATFQEFSTIEHTVKTSYDIEEYLIAFEATNDKGDEKPHFHFIIFTTLKNCINLIQYFVKKYDLATKGGSRGCKRKYGRIKAIRNLQKLKEYCSKDGNIRSSYSEETLSELFRNSFKKDAKQLKVKCQQYVEEQTSSQFQVPTDEIRMLIIEWCMTQKVHVRRTLVDSYLIWTCQNTEFTRLKKNKHQIYL